MKDIIIWDRVKSRSINVLQVPVNTTRVMLNTIVQEVVELINQIRSNYDPRHDGLYYIKVSTSTILASSNAK